jgi:hypothetical protein
MTVRTARLVVFTYTILYAIVLLYPGILPFNRMRPFVFGMPFVLVWVSSWVGLGVIVLYFLERATAREEESRTGPAAGS